MLVNIWNILYILELGKNRVNIKIVLHSKKHSSDYEFEKQFYWFPI